MTTEAPLQVIQGLLINPTTLVAETVSFTPSLEEFYRLLNCQEISNIYIGDHISCTVIEELPAHFADPKLGGIPCTLADDWVQPLCGTFLVTGAPDETGESTSISVQQIGELMRSIFPAVCAVTDGRVKYRFRGKYTVKAMSLN